MLRSFGQRRRLFCEPHKSCLHRDYALIVCSKYRFSSQFSLLKADINDYGLQSLSRRNTQF